MESDRGADLVALGFGQGVGAVTRGLPAGGVFLARAARGEVDPVRDEEGGVEADSELSDEFGARGFA